MDITKENIDELLEKVDYIYKRYQTSRVEPTTALKTEKIELTTDELLFLNMYASSTPIEDEEAANMDVLRMLKTFTNVKNVSLLLLNEDKLSLVTRFSLGEKSDYLKGKKLSTDCGVIQMALQTVDIQSSNKADDILTSYWDETISSYLICPLEEKGIVIGLLLFINKIDQDQFTNKDIEFITQGENVLSKYYYYYENQNLFVTTLKKRNNVEDLKNISRSEMSYIFAEISETIIKLYKKDSGSIHLISDHLKNLLKLLKSYI